MSADLHTRLKIWINNAERAAIGDRYSVYPEESVRDGWHRAYCRAHHECDWTTTGLENPCDEAAYEHVYDRHRSGPHAVAALQALAALRAVIDEHKPETTYPGTTTSVGRFPLCFACDLDGYDADHPEWPCSPIRTIARELELTEGAGRDEQGR
ncbi:hypothetical protein ABT369_38690 [Dactylosporangium sp. NPDC000244]|uniref:hypothetical protein n=1 Tax=Dactylosporangium sp. NPDC000244 TaxID=3154365 RepID=UPI00331B2823